MSHAHAQLRLACTHARIEIDVTVRGVGQAGLAPPNLRYYGRLNSDFGCLEFEFGCLHLYFGVPELGCLNLCFACQNLNFGELHLYVEILCYIMLAEESELLRFNEWHR